MLLFYLKNLQKLDTWRKREKRRRKKKLLIKITLQIKSLYGLSCCLTTDQLASQAGRTLRVVRIRERRGKKVPSDSPAASPRRDHLHKLTSEDPDLLCTPDACLRLIIGARWCTRGRVCDLQNGCCAHQVAKPFYPLR